MTILDKIAITLLWLTAEITNNRIILNGIARIFEEIKEGM